MFGVPMKKSGDANIQELIREEIYAIFDEERDAIRDDAKQQIQRIQEENRKTFNRKRKKAVTYKVGDLVAIKRTQFGTGELAPEFLGPYEIIKVGPLNRYTVRKTTNAEGPKQTMSSADYMKPWSEECEEDNVSETEH